MTWSTLLFAIKATLIAGAGVLLALVLIGVNVGASAGHEAQEELWPSRRALLLSAAFVWTVRALSLILVCAFAWVSAWLLDVKFWDFAP